MMSARPPGGRKGDITIQIMPKVNGMGGWVKLARKDYQC